MQKSLFRKGIVFVIIILFIEASTISNICGNTIKTNELVEERVINEEFVPGEFIVKFKAEAVVDVLEYSDNGMSTGLSSVDILNEKHHVTSVERLFISSKKQGDENTYLNNIFKFSVPQNSDILSIVQAYKLDPLVVFAEPNYIARACMTPDDPNFYLQWALHNTGQGGGTNDADIDAPEAWNIETGDNNIVIMISDTGVDWDHPDLAANIWSNSDEVLDGSDTDGNGFVDDIRGWDFVNNDNNPMDDNGHGTSCAGIAGAVTDNNIGVAGICWKSCIMPVKGLNYHGEGTYSDLVNGIAYSTDNGADVISMSWTGPYAEVIKYVVDYAYDKGVVLVGAAGNDASSVKRYPAALPKVIGVAATNNRDRKVSASNYGTWIDVAAPGWDVYTTDLNNAYTYFGYTSCATPHVAGLAGLILSKTPSYSPAKVMSIIRNNTDPYDSSLYIGTGRINAYKALIEYNTQPNKPNKPSGETQGDTGVEYTYSTTITDPQDDRLYYMWDWGDGTISSWLGLVDSGETITAKHTWYEEGSFEIKVRSKDKFDVVGEWSDPLVLTIQKNRANYNPSFHWIFERFTNMFILLRNLVRLH